MEPEFVTTWKVQLERLIALREQTASRMVRCYLYGRIACLYDLIAECTDRNDPFLVAINSKIIIA